jgi:hypothetical protein
MPTTGETHYTFALAAYTELQLQAEVAAVLPSVLGVGGSPGFVDIVFAAPLTVADQATLAAVVAAHKPVPPTTAQKLDGVQLPPRVAAALVVRLSTAWLTLLPAKQAVVQGVIDAATAAIAQLL